MCASIESEIVEGSVSKVHFSIALAYRILHVAI